MFQNTKDLMEAMRSNRCKPPVTFWNGINVYLSDTYKVRVRTHKNCLIDWFYKLIYGWRDEPYIPEGNDCVYIPEYGLVVRDKETLERIMEAIEKENANESRRYCNQY